jgi:DNA-binding NarL/FixJ family response regulator
MIDTRLPAPLLRSPLVPASPPEAVGQSLPTTAVSVVLADPQPVVRNGLRSLLGKVDDVVVVAEAATRSEALRVATLHRPDVMILDIQIGGPGVIREVVQRAPGVAVLVFTALDDDGSVLAAVRAGAGGYLLKSTGGDSIVRAVHGLAAGEAVFGPVVAGRLTGLLANQPAAERVFPELTPREREVLDLLATGARNAVIARRLGLSSKTVSNHISNVFGKLRVDGRAAAIVLARKAGLGQDDPVVPQET